MTTKLSFVIPAYNEEKYLGACLESVFDEIKNAPCECEVIVVNNASQDNTKKIALSYPGVKVVDEPKKGLSQARQSGFLAAHGDLIANIDADCRLPKGWIQTVLEAFQNDPQLIAFSGPQTFYDYTKAENTIVKIYYYLAYLLYLVNRFVLRSGSVLMGGNYIAKASALKAIGGYNPNFIFYGEDTDIARRLFKIGKVKFSLKLIMNASARRLKHEGILTMGGRYFLNNVWTTFLGRPFTKNYLDINSVQ